MIYLFVLTIRLTIWAFLVLAGLTVLVIWGFIWLVGVGLGVIYAAVGEREQMRRALRRRPPRSISQSRWSDRA
jgi:hypothetical protein